MKALYGEHFLPYAISVKQASEELLGKLCMLTIPVPSSKHLARETICFSKSEVMHDTVIGLFINRFEFGHSICLSLNMYRTLPACEGFDICN